MGIVTALLTLIYIAVCVGLIFFVLIQSSKGAGLSGAFGAAGGSESLFGATGSYTLVVKISVGLAITFLVLSFLFGFLPKEQPQGVMNEYMQEDYVSVQQAVETAPEEGQEVAPGGMEAAPPAGGGEQEGG